ncbi:MAG: protein kinase domain-containing protein [Acidobacteriota bacterium]
MTLPAGTRLGPYEILAPLGAGGMGEVYRARDARLGREVAVKVLPQHLSSEQARQRFEREAKTVSLLSHPHICALYDVGREGETEYLVMELLEGQTLSDHLAKGALSFEQTLRYGIQIADALDKAHRQGVVHRDLKPGNVMLTKAGVKLLDFGLAKEIALPGSPASLTPPTQANLTQAGTILGTFQYMAPEQLEGKQADARTDIFALGAVLYEMATGRRAFSGSSQASLISAIMKEEPAPVSSIQPLTPQAFDHVVRTCLAKSADDRWQSVHDVGRELQWIREGGSERTAPAARRTRVLERAAWAVAAAVAVALAVLLRPAPTASPGFNNAVSFGVSLPKAVSSAAVNPVNTSFALSPDGDSLALLGSTPEGRQIFLRALAARESRAVPGTLGALSPFWSPDGKDLAFFAEGKLRRIALSGGPAVTLCDVANAGTGTWGRDGTILFWEWGGTRAQVLLRVPASGGPVTEATRRAARPDASQGWPTFLPDGKHFLFVSDNGEAWPKEEERQIRIGELGSLETRFVAPTESRCEFAAPGYLLFTRADALFAEAFDPDRAVLRGEPFPVASNVRTYGPTAAADFSVAQSGPVLAIGDWLRSRLVWVARSGREEGEAQPEGCFNSARLSSAGDQLAFSQLDPRLGTADLWIEDLKRGTTERATFDPAGEFAPVWSPGGKRLFYAADVGGGPPDLFWLDRTSGKTALLFHQESIKIPADVSPDGRFLLYDESVRKQTLISVLPLTGESKPFRLLPDDPSSELDPRFSPDGRYLAYVSYESEKPEVYVRPFPGPGQAWRVSRSDGRAPRWSRDGREIFFVSGDVVMAAAVRRERGLETDTPLPLFSANLWGEGDSVVYEVGSDGRFLLLEPAGERRDSGVHVLVNWLAGLRK